MSRKLPYREGNWFLVPLRSEGFALGLIARSAPKGKVLFGYFFGPKLLAEPQLENLSKLKARDALARMKFGDLNLINKKWKVLGENENWDRGKWPFPLFYRKDVLTGRIFLGQYDENDPSVVLSEEVVDSVTADYCEDGLFGAGAVEIILTKLLQQNSFSG
jgi:hypothetical protein